MSGRLRGWLSPYRHPRVAAMLFLGFSAGLPFFLVFQTFSAWLRQAGIERSTIGLLSYVGLVYSLKFLWAPIVDRVPIPILHRVLGRRRSWMLVAQVAIAGALMAIAQGDPAESLTPMVWLTLGVALASATQDIAIDAWRIEAVPLSLQGAMAAGYQFGYRIGILAAQAGALWLAGEYGWLTSYSAMAALMCIGMVTTLIVPEPEASVSRDTREREQRVIDWLEARAHWPEPLRQAGGHFIGAVICPFVDFFQRNGVATGALILAFIGTFRLTDYTMGVMSNPFYLDVGYTLQDIAIVAKGYGLAASLIGVLVGGIGVAQLGVVRSLFIGAVLVIATNLAFMVLAFTGEPSLLGLGLVVSADNFAYQFASTAFIAYLSGLTNTAYTATQYALFSSVFSLPGKVIMGGSGFVVDAIGWPLFFVYTSALGIPALILLALLTRRLPAPPSPAASPGRT